MSSRFWQRDEDVTHCPDCGDAFGVFNRRHHCRVCGYIFCGTCAPYRASGERECTPCFEGINPRGDRDSGSRTGSVAGDEDDSASVASSSMFSSVSRRSASAMSLVGRYGGRTGAQGGATFRTHAPASAAAEPIPGSELLDGDGGGSRAGAVHRPPASGAGSGRPSGLRGAIVFEETDEEDEDEDDEEHSDDGSGSGSEAGSRVSGAEGGTDASSSASSRGRRRRWEEGGGGGDFTGLDDEDDDGRGSSLTGGSSVRSASSRPGAGGAASGGARRLDAFSQRQPRRREDELSAARHAREVAAAAAAARAEAEAAAATVVRDLLSRLRRQGAALSSLQEAYKLALASRADVAATAVGKGGVGAPLPPVPVPPVPRSRRASLSAGLPPSTGGAEGGPGHTACRPVLQVTLPVPPRLGSSSSLASGERQSDSSDASGVQQQLFGGLSWWCALGLQLIPSPLYAPEVAGSVAKEGDLIVVNPSAALLRSVTSGTAASGSGTAASTPLSVATSVGSRIPLAAVETPPAGGLTVGGTLLPLRSPFAPGGGAAAASAGGKLPSISIETPEEGLASGPLRVPALLPRDPAPDAFTVGSFALMVGRLTTLPDGRPSPAQSFNASIGDPSGPPSCASCGRLRPGLILTHVNGVSLAGLGGWAARDVLVKAVAEAAKGGGALPPALLSQQPVTRSGLSGGGASAAAPPPGYVSLTFLFHPLAKMQSQYAALTAAHQEAERGVDALSAALAVAVARVQAVRKDMADRAEKAVRIISHLHSEIRSRDAALEAAKQDAAAARAAARELELRLRYGAILLNGGGSGGDGGAGADLLGSGVTGGAGELLGTGGSGGGGGWGGGSNLTTPLVARQMWQGLARNTNTMLQAAKSSRALLPAPSSRGWVVGQGPAASSSPQSIPVAASAPPTLTLPVAPESPAAPGGRPASMQLSRSGAGVPVPPSSEGSGGPYASTPEPAPSSPSLPGGAYYTDLGAMDAAEAARTLVDMLAAGVQQELAAATAAERKRRRAARREAAALSGSPAAAGAGEDDGSDLDDAAVEDVLYPELSAGGLSALTMKRGGEEEEAVPPVLEPLVDAIYPLLTRLAEASGAVKEVMDKLLPVPKEKKKGSKSGKGSKKSLVGGGGGSNGGSSRGGGKADAAADAVVPTIAASTAAPVVPLSSGAGGGGGLDFLAPLPPPTAATAPLPSAGGGGGGLDFLAPLPPVAPKETPSTPGSRNRSSTVAGGMAGAANAALELLAAGLGGDGEAGVATSGTGVLASEQQDGATSFWARRQAVHLLVALMQREAALAAVRAASARAKALGKETDRLKSALAAAEARASAAEDELSLLRWIQSINAAGASSSGTGGEGGGAAAPASPVLGSSPAPHSYVPPLGGLAGGAGAMPIPGSGADALKPQPARAGIASSFPGGGAGGRPGGGAPAPAAAAAITGSLPGAAGLDPAANIASAAVAALPAPDVWQRYQDEHRSVAMLRSALRESERSGRQLLHRCDALFAENAKLRARLHAALDAGFAAAAAGSSKGSSSGGKGGDAAAADKGGLASGASSKKTVAFVEEGASGAAKAAGAPAGANGATPAAGAAAGTPAATAAAKAAATAPAPAPAAGASAAGAATAGAPAPSPAAPPAEPPAEASGKTKPPKKGKEPKEKDAAAAAPADERDTVDDSMIAPNYDLARTIMFETTFADAPCLTDFLQKRSQEKGKKWSSWVARHFESVAGVVEYFKSATEDKPQNQLDLLDVLGCRLVTAASSGRVNAFEIRIKGGKVYQFAARDVETRDRWYAVFKAALQYNLAVSAASGGGGAGAQ